MNIESQHIAYVKASYNFAAAANKIFGMGIVSMLAQGAHESASGTSYSARVRNNFYGMTAYGSTNPYWDGSKSPSTVNPNLVFRIYKTPLDSFMDFARLIKNDYPEAYAVSGDVNKYAEAISQSKYITEQNGDNRELYCTMVKEYGAIFQQIINELKLQATT